MVDRSRVLSPVDGRYGHVTEGLTDCFSEFALMRARLRVEVEWFLFLATRPEIAELPATIAARRGDLLAIVDGFGDSEMAEIQALERTLKHDVKAVEYYLKSRLDDLGLAAYREFVHFGCTSEDINSNSYAMMLRDLLQCSILPALERLRCRLAELAQAEAATPMLAWTHGQAATPTTVGKEMAVFVMRLQRQIDQGNRLEFLGKFSGATGTFSAHVVAYPDAPWLEMSRAFVGSLGLSHNPVTTQIEPRDAIAECLHLLVRVNSILHDLASDMWHYIARGVFRCAISGAEVGSSTMPHKVNPIDFENAEANCGVGSALLGHLAQKLAVSRMQRDLSDSSALRNIGMGAAYTLLAITSCQRGLERVEVDRGRLEELLAEAPQVLGEAIQTVMRKHGIDQPYERLKGATQGRPVDLASLRSLVLAVGLPEADRERLLHLEPRDYVGLSCELARLVAK